VLSLHYAFQKCDDLLHTSHVFSIWWSCRKSAIVLNITKHTRIPKLWKCYHLLKSCPVTRHEGAWGVRRYSFYSFLTSALDGGEWSASRPGRALPPREGSPVPIGQEAGWASEPVSTQRQEEKSSASVGDRTPVVQSVVRHYNDWVTPAPKSAFLWNQTNVPMVRNLQSYRLS
jgi:hypothetical protein